VNTTEREVIEGESRPKDGEKRVTLEITLNV
jgi:hypothetical protein